GGTRPVKGRGHVVGLLFVQQRQQHHGKAVYGVAGFARGRRQAGQGVVGPVDKAVGVDEDELSPRGRAVPTALRRALGGTLRGAARGGARGAAVQWLLGHSPRSWSVGRSEEHTSELQSR